METSWKHVMYVQCSLTASSQTFAEGKTEANPGIGTERFPGLKPIRRRSTTLATAAPSPAQAMAASASKGADSEELLAFRAQHVCFTMFRMKKNPSL